MAKQTKKLTRSMVMFLQRETDYDTYSYGYNRNTPQELVLVNLKTGEEVHINKADYNNISF